MNGRYIGLLKRAATGKQVKEIVETAARRAPSATRVGEALGGAGRTFAHGVGKYLGMAGQLGGSVAKGLGAGEAGQAVGKAIGIGGAAYLPIHLAGKTEVGRKVEHALGRGVGAVGRGAQRFVNPYDPYAGQY